MSQTCDLNRRRSASRNGRSKLRDHDRNGSDQPDARRKRCNACFAPNNSLVDPIQESWSEYCWLVHKRGEPHLIERRNHRHTRRKPFRRVLQLFPSQSWRPHFDRQRCPSRRQTRQEINAASFYAYGYIERTKHL